MRVRYLAVVAVGVISALGLSACGGNREARGTDLVVTGSGPTGTLLGGATVVFNMSVANVGNDVASNVRIVDTVGNQLALTGITCTAEGGAQCPDTVGVATTVPSMPLGGRLNFQVTGVLAATSFGVVTNTLTATIDDDVDRDNNTYTVQASATSQNLSVTASAPADVVLGGGTANVTMVVTNNGPGTAVDVDITNTPGTGLVLAGTIGCVGTGGAVCPATTGATMRSPSIPAAGILTFTVPLTVAAGSSGTLTNVMTVTAAGESRTQDDSATAFFSAASASLGVSQSTTSQVAAGGTASFTAVVANPGPGAADNVTVEWVLKAPAGVDPALVTVTCTSSATASCPAQTGASMTLPSLAAGRALSFTFSVPVPETVRGTLESVVTLTAAADPDLGNNVASASTVAVDGRNGSYKVFAADGRQYDLSIDFDALGYTMAGNGASVQRSFTADGAAPSLQFTVSGDAKLRTASDLIVGSHDFGTGLLPYIAARKFATALGELGGLYDIASRNLPTTGTPTTRPASARASGSVLQVCETPTDVAATQDCESGYLKSYAMSINGDLFQGVEASSGETIAFRLARIGATSVMLSAATQPDGTRQLRIGLPDSSALAGGSLFGASTRGDWISMALTPTTYSFTGSLGLDDAPLVRVSNLGPFAMMTGTRRTDGTVVYVIQAVPLAVVIDAPTSTEGRLQIALP